MNKIPFEKILEVLGESNVIGTFKDVITGLNRIEHATSTEVTFLDDSRYEKYLDSTHAGVVLIKNGTNYIPKDNQSFISCESPYNAFLRLVHFFEPENNLTCGIHPTAVIEESAIIGNNVSIGANVYIGENTIIKNNSQIFPNVTIQKNVKIGENCKIYPNVSIYFDCQIGNECIIHSGTVIGSDGFGYKENQDGTFTKVPQIGNVIIGNQVEIGSNTTIDRSFVGSTIIGDGVKLDNLIQIAHNDEIGENTAMAAQVGISGSTKVGKRNRFGGQVGISGHIEITDDVVLLAKSGVASSVTKKGVYIGAPIRDKFTAFKIEGAIHNLPQLVRDIEKIKKKLELE